MAALTSIIMGVTGTVGAASSMKQADIAADQARTQKKHLKEQKESTAQAQAQQEATALGVRKDKINKQRKQLMGAGDDAYSIGQTGDAGVQDQSLTGGVLG